MPAEQMPTPDVYSAIASRRAQWDNLLWQVPVLSLTAQAFLLSIALDPGGSTMGRLVSTTLSFLISFLCVDLMRRHRTAELVDAHWLEDVERMLIAHPDNPSDPDRPPPVHTWPGDKIPLPFHGKGFRDARDTHAPRTGRVPFSKQTAFRIWSVGISLFGVVAAFLFIAALAWPEWFAPAT